MHDADSPDANGTDAAAHDQDAGEVGSDDCVEHAILWSTSGGLVAFRRSYFVEPCRTFRAEKATGGTVDVQCDNELPVGEGITAEALNALVVDPDVQAALAEAPVLYGSDPRPVDGTVRLIEIEGARVLVGGPCAPPHSCPIPEGVAALSAVIDDLIAQQQAGDPSCVIE